MKLDAVTVDNAPDAAPAPAGERLTVRVRGLCIEAEVGVYDSERGRKQPIRVDIEAEIACAAARTGAAFSHVVNYAALAETVRRIAGSAHHDLLEDLAQTIARTIFMDERITRLSLSIDKLSALEDAESVGVSLEVWR